MEKNKSIAQVIKKSRKPRVSKNKEIFSPKIKTLVDQFVNITNFNAFQNELNATKSKDKSVNEISKWFFSLMEKEPSYSDLNLHLTINQSFEVMHTSDLDKSVQPLSSQEPAP